MSEKIMKPSEVQIWSSHAVIDIQRINPRLLHWVRIVDFKEALEAQAKLYEGQFGWNK